MNNEKINIRKNNNNLKILLRTKNNEKAISKNIEKNRFEVYLKKGIILEEYGHYVEAKYLYSIASEIAKTLPSNQNNEKLIDNIEKRKFNIDLELMMSSPNSEQDINNIN